MNRHYWGSSRQFLFSLTTGSNWRNVGKVPHVGVYSNESLFKRILLWYFGYKLKFARVDKNYEVLNIFFIISTIIVWGLAFATTFSALKITSKIYYIIAHLNLQIIFKQTITRLKGDISHNYCTGFSFRVY